MEQTTIDAILAHVQAEYPREACGLVIIERGRQKYIPCRNIAAAVGEHFELPGEDSAVAEERGEIVLLVHSHPDGTSTPSDGDRVECEESGLPWLIVAWPGGAMRTIEPCGYEAPLVGRAYAHGLLDCWTLIRDWYARELGIELPDVERRDGWWNDGSSDLYLAHLEEAGGVIVQRSPDIDPKALQVGDVILMQIRSSNGVSNHGAVYVGDSRILHHPYGRLSTRDIYGGYWRECTRYVVRHRQRMSPDKATLNPPSAGFFTPEP